MPEIRSVCNTDLVQLRILIILTSELRDWHMNDMNSWLVFVHWIENNLWTNCECGYIILAEQFVQKIIWFNPITCHDLSRKPHPLSNAKQPDLTVLFDGITIAAQRDFQ